MVSINQREALIEVFAEVAKEASLLPRTKLSAVAVEELLKGYDEEIAMILNAQQLGEFEAVHRNRFAKRVYRDLTRNPSDVPSGVGWSPPPSQVGDY